MKPTTQTAKPTIEQIAEYWAEWCVDSVAGGTQDRQFLRGEPQENSVAIEAIHASAKHAILMALKKNGVHSMTEPKTVTADE